VSPSESAMAGIPAAGSGQGTRVLFEAARGPERHQEGLDRGEMTLRLATTGMLGQLGRIAVKPER